MQDHIFGDSVYGGHGQWGPERGVLNVLPHELLHMYSMLKLDHGLKKPGLGDGGGCSLLTELCGIVRGTGSNGNVCVYPQRTKNKE